MPYKQHPLDEAVDSRMKTVRVKNEDGTTSSYRMDVKYKIARFERYEPFVNLSKTYPFGSKRQGFNNEE